MGLVESFPDAVRCEIAQSAFEASESLQFIAGADGLFQKSPQAISGQKQAFDFVRHPNAEGSSAANCSATVAAEDPPPADRFRLSILFVVAAQKPVPNQVSNAFAMRASCHLQLGMQRVELFLRATNALTHDLIPSRQHPDLRKSDPINNEPMQTSIANRGRGTIF